MTGIVSISKVNFSYHQGPSVLQDVDLEIREGDFLGVVGPNGGGKTTLIKLILGLLRPQSGQIKVFGKDPGQSRSLVGYVPQFAYFDRNFPITVKQMVLLGSLEAPPLKRRFHADDRKETYQKLELLEIGTLADATIGSLSGGQLQRALIARALMTRPRLLILDEPTASVDAKGESTIFEILKRLNSQTSIIVISHDYSFVSQYINRVACINRRIDTHNVSEFQESDLLKVYGQSQAVYHPHHSHNHNHNHNHSNHRDKTDKIKDK